MTYEDLYEVVSRHEKELDAIPEIIEMDYCMHLVLNVPALMIRSKLPPSKKLSAKVNKILENVPCVWWPTEI